MAVSPSRMPSALVLQPFLIIIGQVKSQIVTLRPRHIVMAMGTVHAHIPQLKGMGDFKGAIYHSDQHKDAEIWAGKKAVIVGAVSVPTFFTPGVLC